ncbi:MAG TPA: Uma2 family endonuclease, partial [Trichocoleus sp.]
MVQYNPLDYLPSAAELPDSDDTPVDNELQNLIPNLLEAILAMAWADRTDWFFGVDMGVYHAPHQPPLVPDGFLSL